MTPLQYAKDQCANWQADGSCLGVQLDDGGNPMSCSPLEACLLAAGERCACFEDTLVPMAGWTKDAKEADSRVEAVRQYRDLHDIGIGDQRSCPDCSKPLPPRARYCRQCAKKRKQQSTKIAVQRHRHETKKTQV